MKRRTQQYRAAASLLACFLSFMATLPASDEKPAVDNGGLTTAGGAPDTIKLGDVDFTATLRAREYVWNWFEATGTYNNQYAYSGDLLRLNFADKRGALDLDAEIAVPFLLGLPNTATAPAPQGALGLGSNYFAANSNRQYGAMAFAKQLYARYHFGPKEAQSLQAGRFEFTDASELTPKSATLAALKRDRISQRLIGDLWILGRRPQFRRTPL